eukprot:3393410-Amphidinium_carterae.1
MLHTRGWATKLLGGSHEASAPRTAATVHPSAETGTSKKGFVMEFLCVICHTAKCTHVLTKFLTT